MAASTKVDVRIINQDGGRKNKKFNLGTRLKDAVDVNGYKVLLGGKVMTKNANPELRTGDVIELMRSSGKGGA